MAYGRSASGESWWARQWLSMLDTVGPEYRSILNRGRAAARAGDVRRAEVQPGLLSGTVSSSFGLAYSVRIGVPVLGDRTWVRVIAVLTSKAAYAARLLAGELPTEIEDLFAKEGASLFPQGLWELETTCGCLAAGALCKHTAALHYFFGANLHTQPFVLLALRGRTQQQIVAAIRAQWSASASGESALLASGADGDVEADPAFAPLRVERFFEPGAALDELAAIGMPPQSTAALLQRLGPPPFATEREDVLAPLGRAYAAVTRHAVAALKQSTKRRSAATCGDQTSTATLTE
ncbi:MAG TPA: hypothetical protein VKC57_01470 [Ktedonobacterales bacterium]|nr:hypothetical protein [Ktedonobacterales bacterium]